MLRVARNKSSWPEKIWLFHFAHHPQIIFDRSFRAFFSEVRRAVCAFTFEQGREGWSVLAIPHIRRRGIEVPRFFQPSPFHPSTRNTGAYPWGKFRRFWHFWQSSCDPLLVSLSQTPPTHRGFVENKGQSAIRPSGHRAVEALFSPISHAQLRIFRRDTYSVFKDRPPGTLQPRGNA
jgi:hypothetical protein